jgi:ligand-binding sensor domain-containing protein
LNTGLQLFRQNLESYLGHASISCYARFILLADAGGRKKLTMPFRRALPLLALSGVMLLGAVSFVWFHANRTLNETKSEQSHSGELDFSVISIPAGHGSRFEAFSAPSSFSNAAFFNGKLYVTSSSALFAYDAGGSLVQTWDVGPDLPSSALGSLAVAQLRGASSPQLVVATNEEGILVLDENGAFRQIRASNAVAREVTVILPLPNGDLLLGTRSAGLLVWTGKKLTLFHPGFAQLAVTSLAAAEDGFWVGTRNMGVFHWSGGTVTHFGVEQGMPDADVTSLLVRDDTVLAGTPVGVEQFVHGQPQRLLGKDLFARALSADQHELTIATMDEGLWSVSLDPRGHVALSAASQNDDVLSFTIGPENAVYAILHDRIERRDLNGRWSTVVQSTPSALTDSDISALAFDPSNNLWVGYFDRGLDVLAAGRTRHFEDDHLFCINRIVVDPVRRTMAVATANGLVLFDADGKPRQIMNRSNGLIADHISDVVFRPNGMTLATPAGLTFVDDGQAPQSIYGFQGLVNNHVYALGMQNDGDMLAGTLGGVSLVQHESISRNINAANSGLKTNWITAIAADPGGGWTVGTYGGGVVYISRDGTVHALTHQFVVNPNAMLRTQTHLYVGSLNNGLWIENLSTGRWTNISDGLPSENVTALAAHGGSLYIGTANGLVKAPEASLAQ